MTQETHDRLQSGAESLRAGESATHATGKAIGSAAVILMLGNLASSLLGFIRQATIAKVFGTTGATDAFFAASIVPQMFYDLTIGAAISAALIPTFTEIIEKQGREALGRTLGSVLALAWVALTAVVVVLVIAARPLMTVILWGFQSQAQGAALDQSIQIARILVPTLLFLGTSAVLLSTLFALRRFTVPAFATALYHAGIIAGAIVLARPLGILALPIGALVGAAAQCLVQLPALLRMRVRIRIRIHLTPEVYQILRLYAPVAAGLVVSVGGQIIDMDLKSHLQSGSITAMQLATTLTQFPIGIAVAAMSFAVLPSISSDASFGRMEEFKDTLALGIRLVLFITIPAAVGYIVLATPIVSLLFEHGHFRHASTVNTAMALAGYSIQIPFVGLDQLLIFSFYARKDTVTPMVVGIIGVVTYVIAGVLLLPRLHILGLAVANSFQITVHAGILLAILLSGIGSLSRRGIASAVLRSITAALVMATGAGTLAWFVHLQLASHQTILQVAQVLLPIIVGAGLYLATAALLRSQELLQIRVMVRERFARRGANVKDLQAL